MALTMEAIKSSWPNAILPADPRTGNCVDAFVSTREHNELVEALRDPCKSFQLVVVAVCFVDELEEPRGRCNSIDGSFVVWMWW